jgi:hypothetical protein
MVNVRPIGLLVPGEWISWPWLSYANSMSTSSYRSREYPRRALQ